MAARRKATDAPETPSDAPSGGLSLAVRSSEGVRRAERERKDDETFQAVREALDSTRYDGPKAYDVADEEASKKVVSLLQRAAQALGLGLKKSVTVNGDGTYTVDFEANAVKRERKYTAKEIRAWYGENFKTDAGPAELAGPVPPDVREAFKIANGYAKGSTTLHGATFSNE